MRVLIVNKFLYPNGGSETYIFHLAKVLKKHGNEVQFFGMADPRNIVGNHAGAYTEHMDFHGGSGLSKVTYPLKTIYSREAREKIRAVLEDFQPDVVHLNNFTYQLTPSIIVEIDRWRREQQRDCTILFTAHDYNLICPNHMLLNPDTNRVCTQCLGGHYMNCTRNRCIHGSRAKSLIGTMEAEYWNHRKTYAAIGRVICCSGFMKRMMDTSPVFAEKTVVLHNFATDDMLAQAGGRSSLPQGVPDHYVLYFGRFSEEKGMKTLLAAAGKRKDIPFVFAGRGPMEEEVRGLSNGIDVGFQSGDALHALIRNAGFSIYPSEWYENCPYSVMESQLAGTPVIASRMGGIPELIRCEPDMISAQPADDSAASGPVLSAEPTGALFESGNVDQLADLISRFWDDEALCRKYRENCLHSARDMFDDGDAYYQKYLNLVEKHQPRGALA